MANKTKVILNFLVFMSARGGNKCINSAGKLNFSNSVDRGNKTQGANERKGQEGRIGGKERLSEEVILQLTQGGRRAGWRLGAAGGQGGRERGRKGGVCF